MLFTPRHLAYPGFQVTSRCTWFVSHGVVTLGRKRKSWLAARSTSSPVLLNSLSLIHPQRKVKFATEFDALDVATPELKEKLIAVSRRLKELEKERSERRKVRKRTKTAAQTSAPAPPPGAESSMNVDESAVPSTAGELEDESVYRARELSELEALVDPELKADFGCSVTGLYDLVGESHFAFRWISADGDWTMLSHRDTQGCTSRFRSLYGLREEERVPRIQVVCCNLI